MATRFDYRIEPLADLYNYVREQAMREGDPDAPPDYAASIAAAKALNTKLGEIAGRPLGILGWQYLDQLLLDAKNARDLKRALEGMLSDQTSANILIPAGAEVQALADALIGVEEKFLAELWPSHAAAIQKAKAGIDASFQPKEADCIRFMLESLGMQDPHDVVPVYLVHSAAWPAGFTFSRPGGGGFCTMGVTAKDFAGTLLYETILHEACHALDISSGGGKSVFSELRGKLVAAGMNPRDADMRNIPHTIMFIQAGETIRRKIDPKHKHYGEATTYYERSGCVAEVERPIWIEYLDGKINRATAVDRIVKALSKPAKEPPKKP